MTDPCPEIAESAFYEVLPEIIDACDQCRLSASFTPNNGIRVQILDEEALDSWAVFDFSADQAELIGQALVRWAQRKRAESEIIRCTRKP